MSYHFGKKSLAKLQTCHHDLQLIANTAIKFRDFSVIEGHRTKEKQDQYFLEGKSKLKWPDSKHNLNPSQAFDIIPYPFSQEDWENRELFITFAHYIIGVSHGLGIDLRWGGDWDRDWDLTDNRFNDWPHFELVRS